VKAGRGRSIRRGATVVALVLLGAALTVGTAVAATERPIVYAKTYWKWGGSREEPKLIRWGGLYAAKNGRSQRLTDHAGDQEPAVSPDGTTIAFVRGGDVYAMRADGSKQRRLTRGPRWDGLPQISPHGGYVLFTRRETREHPDGDLYRVALAGGSPHALTSWPGGEEEAAFSLDGRAIVFVRGLPRAGTRDKNFELFSIRPSGSGLARLTRTAQDELHPLYSARGIVFERRQRAVGGPTSIYSMRRDGSEVRQVVARPETHLEAVSPGGRRLVFSGVGRSRGVWSKRLAGSGRGSTRARRLTRLTRWRLTPLVFSPDGRRVATVFSDYGFYLYLASIDVRTGARRGEGESWEAGDEEEEPVWSMMGRGLAW
jgi:dipeptidyl aminopeptidase/acylaminoacyl peptidase